jgi:hypothetical protein
MMRKTEWFPSEVKPVREGFYEMDFDGFPFEESLQYFDGSDFYYCAGFINLGQKAKIKRSWRGLADKPE